MTKWRIIKVAKRDRTMGRVSKGHDHMRQKARLLEMIWTDHRFMQSLFAKGTLI